MSQNKWIYNLELTICMEIKAKVTKIRYHEWGRWECRLSMRLGVDACKKYNMLCRWLKLSSISEPHAKWIKSKERYKLARYARVTLRVLVCLERDRGREIYLSSYWYLPPLPLSSISASIYGKQSLLFKGSGAQGFLSIGRDAERRDYWGIHSWSEIRVLCPSFLRFLRWWDPGRSFRCRAMVLCCSKPPCIS